MVYHISRQKIFKYNCLWPGKVNLTSLGHKDQQERKIGGIGLIKLTMSGQQQRKAKLNNRVGNIKFNLINSVLLLRLDVVPN